MKCVKSIAALSLILLCHSCTKNDGINLFHPTPMDGWSSHDTLNFEVPAVSQTCDFDVQVQVRLTRKYNYSDLWLVVEQDYGEADSLANQSSCVTHHLDTVCMKITDEEGNFTGKGRDLLEYSMPVRFVRLQQGEEGVIRVHHIEGMTDLIGVHDVGMEVARTR